jgi:hypothetical protein
MPSDEIDRHLALLPLLGAVADHRKLLGYPLTAGDEHGRGRRDGLTRAAGYGQAHAPDAVDLGDHLVARRERHLDDRPGDDLIAGLNALAGRLEDASERDDLLQRARLASEVDELQRGPGSSSAAAPARTAVRPLGTRTVSDRIAGTSMWCARGRMRP